MTSRAKGVRPDPVIANPDAEALLIFVDLDQGIGPDGAKRWLEAMTAEIDRLVDDKPGVGPKDGPAARVAVGFGASWFTKFCPNATPLGLASPPTVPSAEPAAGHHDVLFYIMCTAEAVGATFLRGLSTTRSSGLTAVRIERGFQRADHTELAGFRDGVRNVNDKSRRDDVIFVDREHAPDEPRWTHKGTYLAYLKVAQDLERFASLSPEQQEAMMGRRRDGSRLDLPPGTDPRDEPAIPPGVLAPNSHVAKSGPRGDIHDTVEIFRRGVPYLTLGPDGSLDAGLQFVSFQRSLDYFATILDRWMLNPHFPTPGAGADRLFAEGHATIKTAGFYFVPPHDRDRPLGATMFDAPPARRRSKKGRVHVRKRITDQSGAATRADLGGFVFDLLNPDGTPACPPFTTDGAGHARSEKLPTGVYTLRERPRAGFETPADTVITLEEAASIVPVVNRALSEVPGYPG